MNKKGVIISRKGTSWLAENVVYIIIDLVFIAMLAVFISASGFGATFYEQMYAKQIALMIDGSKPGMTVNIVLPKLSEYAKTSVPLVKIENNKVIVKLSAGGGYSYSYFSSYKINYQLYPEGNVLSLEVENA